MTTSTWLCHYVYFDLLIRKQVSLSQKYEEGCLYYLMVLEMLPLETVMKRKSSGSAIGVSPEFNTKIRLLSGVDKRKYQQFPHSEDTGGDFGKYLK